jgi:hypothetical protein
MVTRTILALLVVPAIALARPRVAVAPLDGDKDQRVGDVVAEAVADHAKVTPQDKVARAMDKLHVTELDKKSEKALRTKLEVDAIVHGRVEKSGGGKKRLVLIVAGRGGRESFEVDFASQKALRDELDKRLGKRIRATTEKDAEAADDASEKPRRVADRDDGDDEPRVKKRRRRPPPRHPVTEQTIWLDAGGDVARRTLDYGTTGAATPPPHVGTAAAGLRVEGEVYPFASDSLAGAGGLGVFGEYSRSFGLGIAVPNSGGKTTPISDGHWAVGARYRFAFGTTTFAAGLSYWRRYYIADRSSLAMPTQLDMPDVDYTAIAPGAIVRFALAPTVGAFVSTDVPIVLSGGQILSSTGYGRGTVIAFDVAAGAQIYLGSHVALAIVGELDQVSIAFLAATGSMAATRGVSSATDRSLGLVATIGILF